MATPDIEPGQWVQPRRRGYRMICCDCGLVHRLNFRIVKGIAGRSFIQLQAFRDNAATASARRGKQYRKVRKCFICSRKPPTRRRTSRAG